MCRNNPLFSLDSCIFTCSCMHTGEVRTHWTYAKVGSVWQETRLTFKLLQSRCPLIAIVAILISHLSCIGIALDKYFCTRSSPDKHRWTLSTGTVALYLHLLRDFLLLAHHKFSIYLFLNWITSLKACTPKNVSFVGVYRHFFQIFLTSVYYSLNAAFCLKFSNSVRMEEEPIKVFVVYFGWQNTLNEIIIIIHVDNNDKTKC